MANVLRAEARSLADALTLAFASEDYDDLDSPQFEDRGKETDDACVLVYRHQEGALHDA